MVTGHIDYARQSAKHSICSTGFLYGDTRINDENFRDRLAAVPRTALWLGLAGLIPFVSGGIGVWLNVLGDIRFALPLIVLAYGCLIAAFLGGVRWGAAMQNNQAAHLPCQLILAIMPTLMALVALCCLCRKPLSC